MAAGKKTGGEYKFYYNGTLFTVAPSATAFPAGFSANLLNVRDVSEAESTSDIDFGDRADPKAKRTSSDGKEFTVTIHENAASTDFLVLDDKAALVGTGGNVIACAFVTGVHNETPLLGYIGNFNIVRVSASQNLRDPVLVTFKLTAHSFHTRIKVSA